MSLFHDKYISVYSNKTHNNIAFVCKSHYVDCLINEIGIDNSLGNPTYTPTTHTKGEIRTIIGLCYIPLHFQPKKKNWIYCHSTGFIYYTSVLTNRLYCWVCQMVHETSSQIINIQYIFYQWSKPDFRITMTLDTEGVVYIRCAFWRNIKIC
jgi:hypothetical protein